VKENVLFFVSIFGGVVVSVLCSDKVSVWQSVIRVVCGVILSALFTDPFLAIVEYDPELYRNSVAALFGMCGYAIARVLVNLDRATVIKVIQAVTGKK
jgi:4-amino-4-deoxy-L-arabinose transferase-like glycosyltransferase